MAKGTDFPAKGIKKPQKLASEACEASRGGGFPAPPNLMKNISNSASEIMFSRYDGSASKKAMRGLGVQRYPAVSYTHLTLPTNREV